MLNLYVKSTEALKSLAADKKGVVSFEYIIVAACIVTVVIAVFSGPTNGIKTALTDGIAKVTGAMATLTP